MIVFVTVVLLIFYFIPAFVAVARGSKHNTAITVLNIFLGWTFLGWVVALVWAIADNSERDVIAAASDSALTRGGIRRAFLGTRTDCLLVFPPRAGFAPCPASLFPEAAVSARLCGDVGAFPLPGDNGALSRRTVLLDPAKAHLLLGARNLDKGSSAGEGPIPACGSFPRTARSQNENGPQRRRPFRSLLDQTA